jgi:hypothetical protein
VPTSCVNVWRETLLFYQAMAQRAMPVAPIEVSGGASGMERKIAFRQNSAKIRQSVLSRVGQTVQQSSNSSAVQ